MFGGTLNLLIYRGVYNIYLINRVHTLHTQTHIQV